VTAATSSTWLRVGATVAAGRLRPPVGSSRRRSVCGAARVLTGLGVRVEVHAPATAWPRTGTGLLLVSNTVTALDPLALLTAVPGTAVAGAPDRLAGVPVPAVPAVSARISTHLRLGTSVSVRPEEGARAGAGLGRFSPALLAAAVDAGAAVCPVAVRWRGAASPPPGARSTVAAMRWLAAAPGAVVEVHLLPALSSAGATPRELATTAEYAVAAALEATALSARRPGRPRR
jgi:1-acyl-sn-glycerol-3-phosphate acyltransferase